MHPELLRFALLGHTLVIPGYGALVLLGIGIGIAIAVQRAARHGLTRFDALALGLISVGAGLLGATLLFIAVHAPRLLDAPALPGSGAPLGMVFYGGFIAGAAAAVAYLRAYRLPISAGADLAAVALPVAHAAGRVGCLLAGCCYGAPTRSWLGVRYPDPDAVAYPTARALGPLHPVQLYEAGGLLLIAIAAAAVARRCRPGAAFTAYLGLYALLRLVTETLRGDGAARGAIVPGLATSQLLAILAAAVSLVLYVRLSRRDRQGAAA